MRSRVPAITSTARGSRTVTLRHADRWAKIVEERTERWVTFGATGKTTTMASICDADRGDAVSAENIAKSIAGYFDGEQSRPE